MEKITVKQIENPSHPELSFKHPGAKEYLPARVGRDGKVITGYDENALHILQMEDSKAKAALQKKIIAERLELEKLLGADLTPGSSFWDDFYVVFDDEVTLDPTNPREKLIATWLVANRYVAPSMEAIQDEEDYQNCIYYLHRESEELSRSVENQLAKDEATAKLVSLRKNNPRQLQLIVANLFGYSADVTISADLAYTKAKEYLHADGKVRDQNLHTARFLEIAEKSPESLITKNILDKAIKRKIVSTRNGVFSHGDLVYGHSYEEAVEYLGALENSGELISITKAIEKIS